MAARPTYELGGRGDPVLGDLPVLTRARVTQTIDMPPEIVHVGTGTRWLRDDLVYEVTTEDIGSGYTGLRKVDDDVGEIHGMVVSVSTTTLRNQAGGWLSARPSHRQVEEAPNEMPGESR